MTPEARNILDLIESVDPNDTAALDEIDLLATLYLAKEVNESDKHVYLNGGGLWAVKKSHVQNPKLFSDENWIETEQLFICGEYNKYTRSRDALKSIRPDGWTFHVDATAPKLGIEFVFSKGSKEKCVDCKGDLHRFHPYGEELSELYAIISAIEHERSQK